MRRYSDDVLVEKAQSSDLKAFDKLVSRYEEKIYNLAYRILRNREDAEDVLQETFVSVFKSLKKFKRKSTFSTWVYRIATNAALMKLRKKKLETVSLDAPLKIDEEEIKRETVDWSKNPDKIFKTQRLREIMEQAIELLPYHYKTVFLLRDEEGLSTEEVAKVLNISISAVKSRLHRARLSLREKLTEYFSTGSFEKPKKI